MLRRSWTQRAGYHDRRQGHGDESARQIGIPYGSGAAAVERGVGDGRLLAVPQPSTLHT